MNSHPSAPAGTPQSQVPKNLPKIRRKKAHVDPFFSARKAPTVSLKPIQNGLPAHAPNGLTAAAQPLRSSTPQSQRSASPATAVPVNSASSNAFTESHANAQSTPFTDFKLVTSKRDLLKGLRYHLLQIASDNHLDLRNETDFKKPVRLHRRDPKMMPPVPSEEQIVDQKDGLDQAEREVVNRAKEIRQKERESNLAQIAPSVSAGKKTTHYKRKTQQVYLSNLPPEERERRRDMYEERTPWHLEDDDNKYCFVGQQQVGASGTHAALIWEQGESGSLARLRLVPVEKAYVFKPKRDVIKPTQTIEEVERDMKKRSNEPERLQREREARMDQTRRELEAKRAKGLFSGAQGGTVAGRTGEEADLDFDDDFADDEEGDLFVDKDEDTLLAEKKIKEDQLNANFLDFKDEKEYDIAELREKKEAEAKKKNFRDIRKALERRERNYNHGSDSEKSYGSSTDSEEERERIEKERLAKQMKEEAEEKKSGVSSSGANTPVSRGEKRNGRLSDREGGMKKSSSSNSLKRPGSPNLSDASGTDASVRRKKLKQKHLPSSGPTPQPSRPNSPANVPSSSAPFIRAGLLDPSRQKKRKSIVRGSRAGSDTDTAVYSDAMSSTSQAKRVKNSGIRSPATITPQGGSRSNSPRPSFSSSQAPSQTQPSAAPALPFPTKEEVLAEIPDEGIKTGHLIGLFRHRVHENITQFSALIKAHTRLVDTNEGKLLFKRAPAANGTG